MTVTLKTGRARKRVAVVGTGLAGLTVGYLLARQGCDVYLLEKSPVLGFHSSSLEIPTDAERLNENMSEKERKTAKAWRVDVPMRSFQGGYYPQLLALYSHLRIPIIASDFTFSFSSLPQVPSQPIEAHFIHAGSSGLSIPLFPAKTYKSVSGLVRAISTFASFALCYVFLLVLAFLSHHGLLFSYGERTLADVKFGKGFDTFTETVLVPLFSAVGTMSRSDVRSTRISTILSYIYLTVGTSHYRVHDSVGAKGVAEILTVPVRRVMLGVEIIGMKATNDGITVLIEDHEAIVVDEIVIATPAGAARALVGMYEGALRGWKGAAGELERVRSIKDGLHQVEYRETVVVTHRDHSVLPSDAADVRDINLIQPPLWRSSTCSSMSYTRTEPDVAGSTPFFSPSLEYTMATHIMQAPGSSPSAGRIYQTTNPCMAIRADVLAVARLERALPLRDPRRILKSLRPKFTGGAGPRIHIVGSYAYPGIPLLEGCVGSARRVAQDILPGHSDVLDWTAGEQGGFLGRVWRWQWKSDNNT